MKKYETIIYEETNAVAKITFNRPEAMNALTRDMLLEIKEALEEVEKKDTIRVAVITGSGRAFCAGADLKFAKKELKGLKAQQDFFRLLGNVMHNGIENMGKPVIAAVNGFALAGGFEILLAADLVIASEDARIGDQTINFGLMPGTSAYRLPLAVGLKKAKELLLTGIWLSGKEAEKIGLVNLAVPAHELENAVNEMAAGLAEKSPVAMKLSKNLINRAALMDAEARIELAITHMLVNNTSSDRDEGIKAFTEKRKPNFKGE